MDWENEVCLLYSDELNNLNPGDYCSVKLLFQSFRLVPFKSRFFINCSTFDGVNVVCSGNIDLDYECIATLRKDDQIEIRHVLVKFFKQRLYHVRNDLILLKTSTIHLDGGWIKSIIMAKNNPMTKGRNTPGKQRNRARKSETTAPVSNVLPEIIKPNLPVKKEKNHPPKKGRDRKSSKASQFVPELPDVEVDHSKLIYTCPFFEKCTATLKVDSYVLTPKSNFIFINCSTCDEREVTVVASIKRHDEETQLKEDDLVRFVDAIRVKPKSNNFGLKIEKNTKIFLMSRDGQNLEVSKEVLIYKIIQKKEQELNNNDGRETKLDDCKERGMLKTEFEEINQFRLNIYVADLQLNDGKLIKLVIDKEFGRWPKCLLKPNTRVIFIAISENYQGNEARFIRKSDYFDVDDEFVEEVEEKPKFTCPICFEEFLVEEGRISCTPFENVENDEEIEGHKICVDCIKGIAKAALTDTPLAAGGIGVPCCVPECKNVFLMSEFGIHLDLDVHDTLMLRMQHESILAANMDDLVRCPKCSTMTCVDKDVLYYICTCGVQKCRNCPRLYDHGHYNKTCEELDKLEVLNKIEPSLSEVVVRQCPKCHLQFVKSDGCNKMTCRCGTLQCYLCRAVVQDYTHFCECGTKDFDQPCPKCMKICPLFGDANQFDDQRLRQVKRDNGLLE